MNMSDKAEGAIGKIKKILQHDKTDPTKRMSASVKKGNEGFMADSELKPNKTGSNISGVMRSKKPLRNSSMGY